jgi:hypothetical protein
MGLRSLALALLLAGSGAAPAEAYKLGGKPWPGRTITYHADVRQYADALATAVRAWNASGVRVRFVRTSRRRAALRIIEARGKGGPTFGGSATLGFVRRRDVTARYIVHPKDGYDIAIGGDVRCGQRILFHPTGDRVRVRCQYGPRVNLHPSSAELLRDPLSRTTMALVVAHELGHVLGLDHVVRRCAAMSYERDQVCPSPPRPWQARCRLLEIDDLRGALRRYGGRLRPLAPAFCDVYAPPAPPRALTAAPGASGRVIAASWTNAATPGLQAAHAAAQLGSCPTDPARARAVFTEPGSRGSIELNASTPGSYCVAVWSGDRFGRFSAPATAWVEVPARSAQQEPPPAG